jgi:hypothetical protein
MTGGRPSLSRGGPNGPSSGVVLDSASTRTVKTSLTTTPGGLILARSSKPCWHIGRLLKPTMVSPQGALGASPHGAGRGVSADSPQVTVSGVTRSAKLATMPGVYGVRFAAGTIGRPFAQRE